MKIKESLSRIWFKLESSYFLEIFISERLIDKILNMYDIHNARIKSYINYKLIIICRNN